MQLPYGCDGAVGKELFLRQERAVDIGDNERDLGNELQVLT